MEAGLRAWDRRMPEQRNRILIDHMSDVLLPFNKYHRENLLRENIHPSKIFVTGNPTFEAMWAFLPRIRKSDILTRLGLKPRTAPPPVDRPAGLALFALRPDRRSGRWRRRYSSRAVTYLGEPRMKCLLIRTILVVAVGAAACLPAAATTTLLGW